jgi:nucleoside-diphosphate-sugar epimerase
MKTVEELEAKLAEPCEALMEDLLSIEGDILLLGVGGKMGPSMARLLRNAIRKSGVSRKVYGASRFSSGGLQEALEKDGVETISVDLMDDAKLQTLPDVPNVIYMAGNKFGTSGNEHFTWAMNTYLPGRVAEKFKKSRIVVFSTGNVYPFMPLASGGATESVLPAPVGEYGQSCLGRERIFQHFSHKNQTPMTIFRLNYAIDMRYGVLSELARAVYEQRAIDLTMGHANVIWQGDANQMAIRSLKLCSSPPAIVNITGPETVSLRWAAECFGEMFNRKPKFTGEEASTALLNNASKSHMLFGYPQVSLRQMMEWTAEWVNLGGESWNKPTHFQEREGKF